MNQTVCENLYARFLEATGVKVVEAGGIHWYAYNRFMLPAYLPGLGPAIPAAAAKEALHRSGRPFVRWDTDFNGVSEGEWWYILRRGPWSIEDIAKPKKRWMIRTGAKNFTTRAMEYDEVLEKCPRVAASAASRYEGEAKVESAEALERLVAAGRAVPGVLEFTGCFKDDLLVSYSENHVQENAVWMANIRHDPEHLRYYSSYGLLDGLLEHYLNERGMDYVLDGSRSIHHRTNFQDHLISVFGFTKEYARMNVLYSAPFGLCVRCAYPFREKVWASQKDRAVPLLDNVGAILRQESIRRSGMTG